MNLQIFNRDEETRKKIFEVFDRSEEAVNEDVRIMKEWVKSQPHFPETMEEVEILNFLIRNKFSIEKTKQKIDMYYTIRSLIPDFYEDANPKIPQMKQVLKTNYLCCHPKLVDGLYRVYFFKAKEPNQLDAHHTVLQSFNIAEIRLHKDYAVSEIFLIDLIHISLSDIKKITPTLLAKAFKAYEVFSLRIRAIHLFNSPPYVSMVIAILKAVLKPKIFQRVHVHQDAEIVKEIFAKNDLPKDYGGLGPSLQDLTDIIQKNFVQYEERFDKLDSLRVDESLRPTKLNNDEVLGFYGNFKKLAVD